MSPSLRNTFFCSLCLLSFFLVFCGRPLYFTTSYPDLCLYSLISYFAAILLCYYGLFLGYSRCVVFCLSLLSYVPSPRLEMFCLFAGAVLSCVFALFAPLLVMLLFLYFSLMVFLCVANVWCDLLPALLNIIVLYILLPFRRVFFCVWRRVSQYYLVALFCWEFTFLSCAIVFACWVVMIKGWSRLGRSYRSYRYFRYNRALFIFTYATAHRMWFGTLCCRVTTGVGAYLVPDGPLGFFISLVVPLSPIALVLYRSFVCFARVFSKPLH